MPKIDFTAIDFETANRARGSVCAVGAVRVRDGVAMETLDLLVRPHADLRHFEPMNIRIHGITAADVRDAPEWSTIYPDLREFIGDDVLVAHNTGFDASVFRNVCSLYGIEWPKIPTVCTLQLARRILQLPSYSLPWVTQELGLPDFTHHEAVADAMSAALVLLKLVERRGVASISDLLDSAHLPLNALDRSHLRSATARIGIPDDIRVITNGDAQDFADECVCFSGTLAITRSEAQELVITYGGTVSNGVTKATTILVTGDFDPTTLRPDAKFSNKVAKAMTLAGSGQRIEILTEQEFLDRLPPR